LDNGPSADLNPLAQHVEQALRFKQKIGNDCGDFRRFRFIVGVA
jgi:hypothetical protein